MRTSELAPDIRVRVLTSKSPDEVATGTPGLLPTGGRSDVVPSVPQAPGASKRESPAPPREELASPYPPGAFGNPLPPPVASPAPAPNPSNRLRHESLSAPELLGRPTSTRLSACRRALSRAVPAPEIEW